VTHAHFPSQGGEMVIFENVRLHFLVIPIQGDKVKLQGVVLLIDCNSYNLENFHHVLSILAKKQQGVAYQQKSEKTEHSRFVNHPPPPPAAHPHPRGFEIADNERRH